MRERFKRATCIALTSAVIFSMTGCANIPVGAGKVEDIIDAGDAFAKAAASCDLTKMGKVSAEKFKKDTKDWESILDFSEGEIYDENSALFLSAVVDTIEYEIDEDSAEISKDEASVDVVFTIADYEPILEDEEIRDIDSMIAALEDADTNEIKTTIEFEKDDGEWFVSNYKDIMKDLYKFTDTTSIEFIVDYSECINDIWWNGEGLTTESTDHLTANFTNCSDFNCSLSMDTEACDTSVIHNTVEYNGQVVNSEETNIGMFGTWYTNATLDATEQYLAAGTYTITFYDGDENAFLTVSAVVTVDVTPTPTPAPTSEPTDDSYVYYFESDVGVITSTDAYDPELYAAFAGTPYFVDSEDGAYASGTSSVTLRQPDVTEDMGFVYFSVLYSPTSWATEDEIEVASIVQIAGVRTADDGSLYYDLTFDTDRDGYYIISVQGTSSSPAGGYVLGGICRVGDPN